MAKFKKYKNGGKPSDYTTEDFTNNNITVYPWERGRKDYEQLWLKRACNKSNFIIVDKTGTTEELDKLLDPKKTYVITHEITLENILEKIQKENFPN